MDISEAFQTSLDELRYRRSATTVRTYRNAYVHFIKHIREQFNTPLPESADVFSALNIETERIKILHFNEFLPYMGNQGFDRHSLRVYISAIKYLLKWLIRKEFVDISFKDVYSFEENARDWTRRLNYEPKIPKEGAAEKMLEAAKLLEEVSPIRERDQAIVQFLYCTGCRNAEAAGIKIRDIDIERGIARVTGKGDKTRPVFLNHATVEALSTYWKERKNGSPNAFAFSAHDKGMHGRDTKGLTTRTIGNIVDRVSALAGLDRYAFTPHSFRHAFATRMLRETGNLALVQDLLGHADPKTTRVYATISEEDLKEAHRRVYGS